MDSEIALSDINLSTIVNNMNSESVEISKCLEDISKLFDSLNSSISGELSEKIKSKAAEIEDNFLIIKNCVESYIADFQNLGIAFDNQNSSVSMGNVDLAKGGETVNVKS
ncbi:MAG: hypothetical protein IJK67_02810 [Bacilli bacterium]|nr:hypothetical protein [Bacilli bacterium]